MSHEKYQSCIDACNDCATICNHCAIECLNEGEVHHLTKCIQLDLACAAICRASAELMSLGSDYSKKMCTLCAEICEACAVECDKHEMDHCIDCAEACRECAEICRKMA